MWTVWNNNNKYMRKVFTFLSALFCALVVQAQSLTFLHEGKEVADGATVCSSKLDPKASDPGLVFGDLDLRTTKFIPEITLKGAAGLKVCIRLEGDDSRWAMCCFGGCVTGTTVDKSGTLPAGSEAFDPDVHYEENGFGQTVTRRATLSVWYEGDEAHKTTLKLVVSNDPNVTAVSSAKSDAPAVVVRDGAFHYSFDKAAARTLTVYTIGGAKVMEQALVSAHGTVALSALSSGVYLYQVKGGAQPVVGKFIVK